SIELVWGFLNDPHRMVVCLPGATLVEEVDISNYKGLVTLKMGPVKLKYTGLINFDLRDEKGKKLRLIGKGVDTKGKGSTNINMDATLSEQENNTLVDYIMEISVAGVMAQFGARLITEATHTIFDQFAENVRQSLAGENVDNSLHTSDIVKGLLKRKNEE
ncbi:MAG: carbon monoxide dehydrogenase subunit G, partial [Saprospiraceae bacterium]